MRTTLPAINPALRTHQGCAENCAKEADAVADYRLPRSFRLDCGRAYRRIVAQLLTGKAAASAAANLRARAMQRLTGAERQKRIEPARDAALRLVRPQYNIEIDDELQRVSEFRHNSVVIVYLCPRSVSSNPHRLTIRERGKIVFSRLDGEQLRSSYRPGEWGRVMRECLKTPSGMRV